MHVASDVHYQYSIVEVTRLAFHFYDALRAFEMPEQRPLVA